MAHRPNWPYTFTLSLLYVLTAGHPALAEDTEVLTGPSGQNWAIPNVLFIIDTSGSMGGTIADQSAVPTADNPSRLSVVKDVFADIMRDYAGFNVGLMRFATGGQGGYFVSPMLLLDNDNNGTQGAIINASLGLDPNGSTPLAESMYEAKRFFHGARVQYGKGRHNDNDNRHAIHSVVDKNVEGVNVPYGNSMSPPSSKYISPIISQCQGNYVLLLTDGAPNDDDDADRAIQRLPGYNSGSCGYKEDRYGVTTPDSDDCLDELAEYMNTVDLRPDMNGTQTVKTYTIGFTTDQPLLSETAAKGGGEYIVANDKQQLKNAFSGILEAIQSEIIGANTTFSPPALAANAFSNVTNFDTLYFTLFEPTDEPKWIGNVKPYSLKFNSDGELGVYDKNNSAAIDNEGVFVISSTSLWSNTVDGSSIEVGGANDQQPSATNRKIFTYTGAYTDTDANGVLNSDNTVSLNASDIPYELLGLDEDAADVETKRTDIITATRASTMGDPLHSQPALVTYGGDEENPIMTLFVTTNAGFLHALDAKTGEEQSAFIPKELLKNLGILSNKTGPHPYGLDGDISVWVHDLNNDGDGADTSEHVYLYTGMRRGGNNYYALDVTDPTTPKLLWVIEGNGVNPNFSELGQTWSKPTLANLPVDGRDTKVLIFAGGYDTNQDNTSTNAVGVDDDLGRGIYIVDAKTGVKLWEARGPDLAPEPSETPAETPAIEPPNLTIADMTNSIPSDIRVLDMNYDGYADLLYVGDMRGQIFRFDIDTSGDDFTVEGTLMATLAGDDAANNRRFYYAPDVVMTQKPGGSLYLSINIGSGYRAHPLNPVDAEGQLGTLVQDAFYSLRDPYVNGLKPSDEDNNFATIEEQDLYNATSVLVDGTTPLSELGNGWRIDLASNGEKVLAPAITINKQILFTTYTPPSLVEREDCNPPAGTGNLYRVSLFDGNPMFAAQTTGSPPPLSAADRSTKLKRSGIPPAPVVVFKEGKGNNAGNIDIVDCVGTECRKSQQQPTMTKTYWRDES